MERTGVIQKCLNAIRERPRPEDVTSVIRKSGPGAAGSIANALIFTFSTWPYSGGLFLGAWCLSVILLSGFVAARSRHAQGAAMARVSRRGARRLNLFSALVASPWGILAGVILVTGSEFERLMMMIVCAGMMAGATFMLYRTLAACISYHFAVLAPLFIACLIADFALFWPIAVYATVFGAYLAMFAHQTGTTARQRDDSVIQLSQTVGELEVAHEKISQLAYFDSITKLPNRKAYIDRLRETVSWAQEEDKVFSVVMLDLDRFKNINDTLGHQFGDLLLALVGKRLSAAIRADDMIARLGGDEFAVIVPGVSKDEDLHNLGRRLVNSLTEPAWLDSRQVFPGTSVGIARFPQDGDTGQEILLKADIALNRAKETGRGQYILFNSSLSARVDESNWLEEELRVAIRKHLFVMHYQPKVDLNSGKIVGVEALVRWPHESEGIIGPQQFLPVAAERGLLPQVTRCILEQVTNDIVMWKGAGFRPGKVAINIHALDLKSPVDLMSNLKGLLANGISPNDIILEVTEGCFVGRGTDSTPLVLDAISDLGFELSLDDFGTGYASLTHLRKLPVSEIKIDRSFVTDLGKSRGDKAIISATIEIARGMGLRLVAEGVETREQAQVLRQLGVEAAQGYYWSKPVSAADIMRKRNDRGGGGFWFPPDSIKSAS